MQLMADATEGLWMESWLGTIEFSVESHLNIRDTYWMIAGSYTWDNRKKVNL